MRHKIIFFCMILWLALAMPMTAVAGELDTGKTGSLTVSLVEPVSGTPMAGAEISLYYVASAQGGSSNLKYAYTYTGRHCSCGSGTGCGNDSKNAEIKAYSGEKCKN